MTLNSSAFAISGLALVSLLIGGLNLAEQGPVGPDMGLTLALQSLFPPPAGWAQWLTGTAKAPLLFGTLLVGAVLAWMVSGWRGGIAVPLAYAFAFGIDKALRALIHSTKPLEDLVHVAKASSASGLPSTFALVYASVFGVALMAKGTGRLASVATLLAGLLILTGCSARIVLGGHWPSQMLASAALGLILAWIASALVSRLGRR